MHEILLLFIYGEPSSTE